MTSRHAVLGALLALPIALLALATPPGERAAALAAAGPALAGLIALDHLLRQRVSEGTAFWTLVLAVYGTELYPLLAHAPDALRSIAFLLGAAAVAMLPRWPGPSPARRGAFLVALVAGALLSARSAPETLDPVRALLGSRGGLLFWTPLLWASLAGMVVLVWREGRGAVPVVAVGLAPLAAASFLGQLDVALPALMVALAAALDAACRMIRRRPAWVLAGGLPLLAVSNLLFMHQYRHTLRRDDTVSFPQVSEGNARLLSQAAGSPVAWPANWWWSARHDLPVERWDLLSGLRLDPRKGVAIDVGDLEQDAAFLLDGWSVRHPCGDSICREVEGRAEVVLPLERATTADLHVFVWGDGALRVSVDGEVVGTIEVHGEFADRGLPRCAWRRGVNRVVLESLGGTSLVDRLEVRRSVDR